MDVRSFKGVDEEIRERTKGGREDHDVYIFTVMGLGSDDLECQINLAGSTIYFMLINWVVRRRYSVGCEYVPFNMCWIYR